MNKYPLITNNYTHIDPSNCYDILLSTDTLLKAFLNTKKGVKWKESIQYYDYDLISKLLKLASDLEKFTYKIGKTHEFDLDERGKKRHIKAPAVNDRVLHHALCDDILMPILLKYLIFDNGASIKHKGLDFARNRFRDHIHSYWKNHQTNKGYILLIDFSKFFDNIIHDKLLELFGEFITDERLLMLLNYILSTFCIDGDYTKSVGIGSQLSQVAGIFYPMKIDNYVKTVRSMKYYGRYMDDIYVISDNKEELQDILLNIRKIADYYGIIINEKKTRIERLETSKGVKWLQIRYILKENGKILKIIPRKTIHRTKRRMKKIKKMIDSGKKTLDDAFHNYKSWRGSYIKFDSKQAIYNLDKYFELIYGVKIIYLRNHNIDYFIPDKSETINTESK